MWLIMVEWTDSAFCQGWMEKSAVKNHRPSRITTVGILAEDAKEHITIMQSVSNKNDVGDGITIPKCSIIRVRTLKVRGNK